MAITGTATAKRGKNEFPEIPLSGFKERNSTQLTYVRNKMGD
jgi:hypothetical protein